MRAHSTYMNFPSCWSSITNSHDVKQLASNGAPNTKTRRKRKYKDDLHYYRRQAKAYNATTSLSGSVLWFWRTLFMNFMLKILRQLERDPQIYCFQKI